MEQDMTDNLFEEFCRGEEAQKWDSMEAQEELKRDIK